MTDESVTKNHQYNTSRPMYSCQKEYANKTNKQIRNSKNLHIKHLNPL